uniref:Uncharacterized protein n=1 Tax=Phragmatopoma lapidosa TaxID=341668 RepID=A0A0A0QYD2_9ANNE|nr:hypothetical protein [Phragmatopoma lapidosa]
MASLISRSLANLSRKPGFISLARAYSDVPYIDPDKGKVASNNISMPDTLGHAVGPERFELLAKAAGNEDPFEMNVKRRAKGTKDEPTLIPSMYERRLVGCICEEDSLSINWMYLHKGEEKRCACGFYFKLSELQHQDYGQ